MTETPNKRAIGLIGFGEAGKAFAEGWHRSAATLTTYDIKLDASETRDDIATAAQGLGVTAAENLEQALKNADCVFSFVTADQALIAATNAAPFLKEGALYFDCNSCAPDTKRQAAILIDAAGGRYVDTAVMAPVHPNLNRTPVNISGPHAEAALEVTEDLDLNATRLEGDVGTASATKMVRSIMMKGLEALMMECSLAGRKAGVETLVFDSLDKTYPGFNFRQKATYMAERMMVHGVRRAAEMREVAKTVEQLGLDNRIVCATVDWQQKIGDMALDPDYALGEEDYGPRIDKILAALSEDAPEKD